MAEIREDLPDRPEDWVDQYGDALYRFALARVKDPSTAEELVQEALVSAIGSRASYQGRSSRKTWLTAILKYKIVDHYRKSRREQPYEDLDRVDVHEASGDDLFNERGGWSLQPAKWSADPGKIQEQREFLDIFYRCLGALPERLARVFMLREIDGADTEEICQELEVTATNSWTMLYRARMGLRRCLENGWPGARMERG
ncbi:sigma-70 family RNA polymerase sigma factor [Desulfococcus sp.]|uniref:sigma-70 family RNA polymerase sigma factor n=1 Tax=Desulfococcus sp. TaxID=2025834 RepID=UPI003594897A